MPTPASQPAPNAALSDWERRLRRLMAAQRAALRKTAAAGELTRARRLAIIQDTVGAIGQASARLIETTARDPYPPAGPCRDEAS